MLFAIVFKLKNYMLPKVLSMSKENKIVLIIVNYYYLHNDYTTDNYSTFYENQKCLTISV